MIAASSAVQDRVDALTSTIIAQAIRIKQLERELDELNKSNVVLESAVDNYRNHRRHRSL
jgi:hypothetical protein